LQTADPIQGKHADVIPGDRQKAAHGELLMSSREASDDLPTDHQTTVSCVDHFPFSLCNSAVASNKIRLSLLASPTAQT